MMFVTLCELPSDTPRVTRRDVGHIAVWSKEKVPFGTPENPKTECRGDCSSAKGSLLVTTEDPADGPRARQRTPRSTKKGRPYGRPLMVELRGFEPLTFSMRTRRATNCAIAPCGRPI